MNLYHISRIDNYNYGEYSDAVVAANNEEEARNIHPDGNDSKWNAEHNGWMNETDYQYVNEAWWYGCRDWPSPDKVTVDYIGIAAEHIKIGTVICASFHAG